jgi:glycosyltransferase involved in cell wall biosynthesis
MISVCMATKNGASYIAQQLDSILPQLHYLDEVIISDDSSTDNTVEIVQSYNDARIKIIRNKNQKGILKNFETSLRASSGDFVFLADQDDVWLASKVEVMLRHLQQYDLVISDCQVVDQALKIKAESFFTANNSGSGLIKNLYRNSYMGCCMAFSRKVLNCALPFPKEIPVHDFWIGLIGEMYFKVYFTPEVLVKYRRHYNNASSTGEKSLLSLSRKVEQRLKTIKSLFLHKRYAA